MTTVNLRVFFWYLLASKVDVKLSSAWLSIGDLDFDSTESSCWAEATTAGEFLGKVRQEMPGLRETYGGKGRGGKGIL